MLTDNRHVQNRRHLLMMIPQSDGTLIFKFTNSLAETGTGCKCTYNESAAAVTKVEKAKTPD